MNTATARWVVVIAAASVALSALPRVMLAAGALPAWARPFIWSDVYATYEIHLRGGQVPYFTTFFDYPPAIGYAAGLFATVAGSVVPYLLLWALLSMVAAAAVAWLIAREASPGHALLFWSLSPQLLLYGAANFDVIPVFLVVAATVAARQGRPVLPYVLLAFGMLAKVFPGVAIPVLLERLRRANGMAATVRPAIAFAVVVLGVAAPSLLAAHPSTEGIVVQGMRTNFDSVWGLVLATLDTLGVPAGGTIVAGLSLIGLGITYVYVLRRADPSVDPIHLTFLAVLALLLWTRLYSPQYSLWVLPFIALLNIPLRPFVILTVADVIVFVTVYPLTLVPWSTSGPLPTMLFAMLAAGIVLRHAGLIALWSAAARQGAARS